VIIFLQYYEVAKVEIPLKLPAQVFKLSVSRVHILCNWMEPHDNKSLRNDVLYGGKKIPSLKFNSLWN
jgi:hypothetical protein